MQIPDYTKDSVEKALTGRRSLPIFPVSSLGQYCEVTDFIRRAWVNKVNARQHESEQGSENLKGYVGEILPWFRGAEKKKGMLTPKLAREWIKYNKYKKKQAKKRVASSNPDHLDHKSIYDLEDYYFDRFTRFGRPFLGG